MEAYNKVGFQVMCLLAQEIDLEETASIRGYLGGWRLS
jgi:hypothetical protein